MNRNSCPLCRDFLVEPSGPSDASVLLVGEYPGYYEIQSGIPFVGPSGDVLKQELAKVSVDWRRVRLTNLWLHNKKEKDEAEVNYHLGRLIQEMEGRRAVLLMGSDTSKTILDANVLEVSGLEMKSPLVPPSVEVLMATVNPAFVLHDTVGEFRLAIQKFFRKAKKFL